MIIVQVKNSSSFIICPYFRPPLPSLSRFRPFIVFMAGKKLLSISQKMFDFSPIIPSLVTTALKNIFCAV